MALSEPTGQKKPGISNPCAPIDAAIDLGSRSVGATLVVVNALNGLIFRRLSG
jgi:hypothetical protein